MREEEVGVVRSLGEGGARMAVLGESPDAVGGALVGRLELVGLTACLVEEWGWCGDQCLVEVGL